jgi:hypothetical protein
VAPFDPGIAGARRCYLGEEVFWISLSVMHH